MPKICLKIGKVHGTGILVGRGILSKIAPAILLGDLNLAPNVEGLT